MHCTSVATTEIQLLDCRQQYKPLLTDTQPREVRSYPKKRKAARQHAAMADVTGTSGHREYVMFRNEIRWVAMRRILAQQTLIFRNTGDAILLYGLQVKLYIWNISNTACAGKLVWIRPIVRTSRFHNQQWHEAHLARDQRMCASGLLVASWEHFANKNSRWTTP